MATPAPSLTVRAAQAALSSDFLAAKLPDCCKATSNAFFFLHAHPNSDPYEANFGDPCPSQSFDHDSLEAKTLFFVPSLLNCTLFFSITDTGKGCTHNVAAVQNERPVL